MIVGTDAWQLDVTLGETEIVQVEQGDEVDITTDDDVSLTGKVTEVGKLPSTTSGSAAFTVSITASVDEEKNQKADATDGGSADDADASATGTAPKVYDGTGATAKIITERRDDVLAVPSSAVTTDGGASTVTLVDGDTRTEQTVTTGDTSDDMIEITDGLSEGDTVLITVFTPGASGSAGEDGDQFPQQNGSGQGGENQQGFPGGDSGGQGAPGGFSGSPGDQGGPGGGSGGQGGGQ